MDVSINLESEDPIQVDIQAQLTKLREEHERAMATIAGLRGEDNRSYVYISRERHIAPFSGDLEKDGRSVDNFIEEIERVLRTMANRSAHDKYDFVMSLLKGSALEEVRLCTDDKPIPVEDLYKHLREAFTDKRSVPQLLHDFYSCKQREGEDILDYSHAVRKALQQVVKCSPTSISNVQVALRDQFVEGIREPTLRQELRRYVRGKPASTMVEVREEASLWTMEEPSAHAKSTKSKSRVSDQGDEAYCAAVGASGQNPMSLNDVLKVVSEQGKQINELTQAIKDLTTQTATTSRVQPRAPLRFTQDGKPICLKCQKEGHIAKECPQKYKVRGVVNSGAQGNDPPQLL